MILGAGASMPYGFPSGYDLIWDIIECIEFGIKCRSQTREEVIERECNNRIEDLKKSGRNYYFIKSSRSIVSYIISLVAKKTKRPCGSIEEQAPISTEIENFSRALKYSGCHSIDFFLEKRGEQEAFIGKLMIAALLTLNEQEERFFTYELGSEWYGWLYNKLLNGNKLEQFGADGLHIITFNYDRSFEHFLFKALSTTYPDRSPQDIWERIDTLKIKHVYGSLGEIRNHKDNYKSYEVGLSEELLDKSAKSIYTISESMVSPEIKGITESHHHFVFIGFGYNKRNIERLGIFDGRVGHKEIVVSGSTYGLSVAEVDALRSYFCKQSSFVNVERLRPSDEKVDKYLRNYRFDDLFIQKFRGKS